MQDCWSAVEVRHSSQQAGSVQSRAPPGRLWGSLEVRWSLSPFVAGSPL